MVRFHSALALSLLVLSCSAAASRKSQSMQEVALPNDYAIDLQLGIASRSTMMSGSAELTGTLYNQVGDQVFQRLIGSSFNLPYSWKLTLVNDQVINASSSAAGQVYVYGGMLPLVGTSPGLWAAVLSHEIIHTAYRHQVRDYLEQLYIQRTIAYYRYRVELGDKSANWALAGFQIAAPLLLKKMERDQEHQADQEGMLLMAQAGYHPDYVFALHHLMAANVGDQSKFAAFFSDHPRWATRDERDERTYSQALAEFHRMWPNPSMSPGGIPPAIALLGQPKAMADKSSGTTEITVPMFCRNAATPVELTLAFEKGGHSLPSTDPAFADKNGNAVYSQRANCDDTDMKSTVALRVPADITREHSAKAVIVVMDGTTQLASSRTFDVKFPKVRRDTRHEVAAARPAAAAPSLPGVQTPASPQKPMPEPSEWQNVPAASSSAKQVESTMDSTQAFKSPVPSSGVVQESAIQNANTLAGNRGSAAPMRLAKPAEPGYLGALAQGNRRIRHDGVTLFSVIQGSPADLAGLQTGDVIEKIDTTYVYSIDELMQEVAKHSAGSRITIQYRRGALSSQTYAILGRNPDRK